MGGPVILGVDLDRTLIYSNRFLDKYPMPSSSTPIQVERTEKSESFVSSQVLEKLLRIKEEHRNKIIIVPVTSRSISEYLRIDLPGVNFEYAITSAGGVILHDNKKIPEWESYIDNMIDLDGMDSLMKRIDKLESTDYKSKVIDGVYVFSKCKDVGVAKKEIEALRKKTHGFDIRMDKHKIYATNSGINKGTALKWLKDRLKAPSIVALGDSMMDVSMFSEADKSFTPTHNTIEHTIIENNRLTVVSGGTDCILNVLNWMEENL